MKLIRDLCQSHNAVEIKTKKWDLIKLTNFVQQRKQWKKLKRQSTKWEKVFANDVVD